MARIAFWTSSHLPDLGGFQWSTYRLACHLKSLGHEPMFITMDKRQELPKLDVAEIRFGGDTVLDWTITSGNWLKNHVSDFDLIHMIDLFYNAADEQLAVIKECGLPSLIKIPTQGYVKKLISTPARFAGFSCISAYSVLNLGIAAELEEIGIKNEKIWHIPNGVETEKFKPCQDSILELRNRLRLPQNKVLALFIGRWVRRKRLDTLLSAMKLISGDVFLVIVGSGFSQRDSVEEEIRMNAANMENVRLIEATPNVLPYFQCCDMHILLSDCEGQPNTVIEGMACQIPTIVTDIPGLGEVVDDGISGFVVPVGDVKAVARAIDTLAADEECRKKMGIAAREKVLNSYAIETVASIYERLYQKISESGG